MFCASSSCSSSLPLSGARRLKSPAMICRVVRLISASRRSALTASSTPPSERERERQRDAVERRAAQHLPDRGELADVAADEQAKAGRRAAASRARASSLSGCTKSTHWPRASSTPRGHAAHVAGERAADRVGEQIERAALGVALRRARR